MPPHRTVGLSSVALLVAAWVVLRPEVWQVEHLRFEGAARATVAELRHLSDVRNGTSIWEVDTGAVAEAVGRHPWVASVTVSRRLPSTVRVVVEEHEPVALLAWGDELFYVDAAGAPFLRARSDDLDYPVITGVTPALEEAHPDLPRWVLHDALWLLGELDARRLLSQERVSEIAFAKSRGFTFTTTGGGAGRATARLLIGHGDYERQLAHLDALLAQGVDLTQPVQVDVAPETVAIVRPLDRARVTVMP